MSFITARARMQSSILSRIGIFLIAGLVHGTSTISGQSERSLRTSTEVDRLQIPMTAEPSRWTVEREIKEGAAYLAGRGVPENATIAAYWYRVAAEQGDPRAENELGYFYTAGVGVKANPAEAVKWYERAVAGGSPAAKLNLAVMSLKGVGISRDSQFGIDLLQQLASVHYGRAEAYLGFIYELGYGVAENGQLAKKWYTAAAKHHAPEGEYGLGMLLCCSADPGRPQDFARSARLLRSSARAGYVPAMYGLGNLLLKHPELSKAPDEAMTNLRKAAGGGFWQASVVLGTLSRDGTSGAPNMADAYSWFTIAIRQGGPTAETLLSASRTKCALALSVDLRQREDQLVEAWLHKHSVVDLFILPTEFHEGPFPATTIPVLGSEDEGTKSAVSSRVDTHSTRAPSS